MNVTTATGTAGNSVVTKKAQENIAADKAAAPESFEDMFTPVTTVTFGGEGISMADLAKSFTKKKGGGGTFDFSNLPGVTITRRDEK